MFGASPTVDRSFNVPETDRLNNNLINSNSGAGEFGVPLSTSLGSNLIFRCSDSQSAEQSTAAGFLAPFQDASIVTRCATFVGSGAIGTSHEGIMGNLDRPIEYVASKPKKSTFAPGCVSDSPTRPPLMPASTLCTIFDCSKESDKIVELIGKILDAGKVTSQFSSFDYCWNCSYVSGYHVSFSVRLYRYSVRHIKTGQFAVEFQRVEGDRFPFMNIYNRCRDVLTREVDFFEAEEAVDCDNGFATDSKVEVTIAPKPENPELKESIVKQLAMHSTYTSVLENIQLVSTIYSNSPDMMCSESSEPKLVDRELFLAVCAIAAHYSSNRRDWVYQHSIIAVANMLALFAQTHATAHAFMSFVGLSEGVKLLLRTMAASRADNVFLCSKSEEISKHLTLLNWN